MDKFVGKVVTYTNINGKEHKLEKEFTSKEEYDKFLQETPSLQAGSFYSRGNSVVDLFEALFSPFEISMREPLSFAGSTLRNSNTKLKAPVDLAEYEEELAKIEQEKKDRDSKKANLESAKSSLETFIKTFKKEKKEDLVKKAELDLKKVEDELKAFV